MIAAAFAYATAVTLLIGLAAASLERLLAELALPRRLAWLGASALAVAFPLASLLAADPPAAVELLALPAASVAPPAAPRWDALLLALWGVASSVLLLGYLAAWIRLAAAARRWAPLPNERAPIVLAEDVGPAVLGIFRPRIVLPRWLADAPEHVRSTVVAHELEHIAARDQAAIVAAQLVTVLLPWNLPLWWFARRLRAAIEIDCDTRVLRRGVDAEHYADVLLAVGQRATSSPYLAAALIEPVTQLERRIRIMLARRKPGAGTRAAAAGALALAIAACATQVEAPAVVAPTVSPAVAAEDPAPALDPALRVPFVLTMGGPPTGTGRFLVTRGGLIARQQPDGSLTLEADRMIVSDVATARVTADWLAQSRSPERVVFMGNVELELGQTSVTASRADAIRAEDGRMTLELENAVVRRQADDTAAEERP